MSTTSSEKNDRSSCPSRSPHQDTKDGPMADYVQVLTTTESREDAYRLAHQLIGTGYAAVVQVNGPVVSIFRQDSVVVEAQQWQLVLRTMSTHIRAIEECIRAHHRHHPRPARRCLDGRSERPSRAVRQRRHSRPA
ncbi:divalent cation tolerance protein CutA [Nonomuraea sp. NPDC049709]|uniref:divalent cation tolerance protein CutA n=1 Tax=Nonomuraea sp. NPDC049709 TaxID=3154736 RepID=UPI00341B8733